MDNYSVLLYLTDELNDLEYQSDSYNAQQSDIEKLNSENKGHKGFFFSGGNRDTNYGCWLDGTFKFFSAQKKYAGFLGNVLSDAAGNFSVPQTVQVSSIKPLTTLFIEFDRIAGEYATEIVINNVVYSNKNFLFAINASEFNTKQLTIQITKWNRPGCVAKITRVVCGMRKEYDSKKLQGLEYTEAKISGTNLLSFGILTQTGTVSIKDDYTLKVCNEAKILPNKMKIGIKKNNKLITTFISSTITEEDFNNIWTIELADETINWEEQPFKGINEIGERSLDTIIKEIIWPMEYESDEVEARMKTLKIPNSYLHPSTKWQALVKCCNIGLLRIYIRAGIPCVGSLL